MPPAIPLLVGLAAAAGASSSGIAAGIGAAIGLSASTVAAFIGGVVSIATGLLISAITKPRAARPSSTGQQEDRKQLIRGPIEPRQVIYGYARVSGAIVYAASSGANLRYLHLVVVVAGHVVDAIPVVWLNNQTITAADCDAAGNVTRADHPMRGRVRIERYLGDQTSGNLTLAAESPDGWSATHVLTGCAYLYIRLEYDQDRMPGLQSIEAEVRGKRDIWDPRSNTFGFTSNWALCVLDYLRSPHGLDCDDDELDIESFKAAANLSDEAVQIAADGSTQTRYLCDGSFKLDRTPADIMEAMLSAGGGALVYIQGQYRLHGAAYSAPTASIEPRDMAGEMEIVPRVARKELFNGVRGTFIDPERGFQASEFGAVFDTGYDDQDGGSRIWKDVELPFTQDNLRAQRLARMILLRARQSLRIKVPMKYSALRLCVWQMVSVSHPDLGLTNRPMRIVGWEYEPNTGGVMVEMQAEASSAYAWLYDDAYSAPAPPDTTLVNPLVLAAPAAPTVTPSTVLQNDGSTVPSLIITWAEPPIAFITGVELQYRPAGGAWTTLVGEAAARRMEVSPVLSTVTYEARIRWMAGLSRSPYSGGATAVSDRDTTAPGVPASVGAAGVIRGVLVAWAPVTDADFDFCKVWERVNPGDAWSLIATTKGTSYPRTDLPPGVTRRYSVTAVDRSGNESARSAEAVATTLGVSDTAAASASVDITLTPPVSGYSYQQLVSVGINVALSDNGNLVIVVDGNESAILNILYVDYNTGGGSDGGGGGVE